MYGQWHAQLQASCWAGATLSSWHGSLSMHQQLFLLAWLSDMSASMQPDLGTMQLAGWRHKLSVKPRAYAMAQSLAARAAANQGKAQHVHPAAATRER